jgi:hypothetical protein
MDPIDMYFLNRIRPDSPPMPRVACPTTASGTPAGGERAAILLQIDLTLGECLLMALFLHPTRSDECPLLGVERT